MSEDQLEQYIKNIISKLGDPEEEDGAGIAVKKPKSPKLRQWVRRSKFRRRTKNLSERMPLLELESKYYQHAHLQSFSDRWREPRYPDPTWLSAAHASEQMGHAS